MNKLEIIENTAGQRIIFVTEKDHASLNIDHSDISYEQFDAVMYTTTNGYLLSDQFRQLSPITQSKFYLKPFFVNPAVENASLLRDAADGLSFDHNDPVVIDTIKKLLKKFVDLNIETGKNISLFDGYYIVVTLARFFLSRGGLPRPKLKAGTHTGYYVDLIEFHANYYSISGEDVLAFFEYGFNRGYVELIEDIDIVYFCKRCTNTHLIYTFICPECSSHRIDKREVLHHYPCANVSLETSYINNNFLICPKCKKKLLHIGVDYDRPIGMYSCAECSINFTKANMRVTCVNCRSVMKLHELGKQNILHYRYTELGTAELAKWSVYTLEDKDTVGAGVASISKFKEHLTCTAEMCKAYPSNRLVVIRINNILPMVTREISILIFDSLPNAICSFKHSTLYIAVVYRVKSETFLEDNIKLINSYVKKIDLDGCLDVDYVIYEGEDMASYIIRLKSREIKKEHA